MTKRTTLRRTKTDILVTPSSRLISLTTAATANVNTSFALRHHNLQPSQLYTKVLQKGIQQVSKKVSRDIQKATHKIINATL